MVILPQEQSMLASSSDRNYASIASLPAHTMQGSQVSQERLKSVHAGESKHTHSRPQHIWLLESNPNVRRAIHFQTQSLGFTTHIFEHIQAIYHQLTSNYTAWQGTDIWLLLSVEDIGERLPHDIQMLRRIPHAQHIPMIVLGASDKTHYVEWALDLGANDFLYKPIRNLDLKTRIRGLQKLQSVTHSLHANTSGIRKDLQAASELQKSLLPTSPIRKPGIEFCWSYRPYGYVAGDMLNVFTLAEDLYGLYVADVCGHGAAAAMMSIWLSHTLYPPKQSTPSELRRTSEALSAMLLKPSYACAFLESKLADMKHDLYFTMLYAIFDRQQRRFIYSRCGHPYPIVLKKSGECRSIEDPGGPAIGMELGIPFTEHSIQCDSNDRIFLYSDGLLEAVAPNGEYFGQGRLIHHLQKTRHLSLQEQVSSITQAVTSFQGKKQFDDDVTILGIALD